jgi:hypothetical protein
MTPSRNKPGVAFWATTVVVVVLVAYPLSFGPACWLATSHAEYTTLVRYFYRPLKRLAFACFSDDAILHLLRLCTWERDPDERVLYGPAGQIIFADDFLRRPKRNPAWRFGRLW